MLPTKFRFIFWPSGFRGEDLKKSANQKQELPVAAMFANGSGRNDGPPQSILVSDLPMCLNLLLWNRLAKLTET
jgi:hypothetical protein